MARSRRPRGGFHECHGPHRAALPEGSRIALTQRVQTVPPSGIRRFFDIVANMPQVISLGIGEPDFVTPPAILAAGVRSLEAGKTGYTSNSGLIELRQALADHLRAVV